MATIPLCLPPASMADYWRETIGDVYKPVKWNPRWADHPLRVREVLAKLRAGEPCPEACDVIIGIIHSMSVAENTQSALSEMVIKMQDYPTDLPDRFRDESHEFFIGWKEHQANVQFDLRASPDWCRGWIERGHLLANIEHRVLTDVLNTYEDRPSAQFRRWLVGEIERRAPPDST